jgi:hypothetical protein
MIGAARLRLHLLLLVLFAIAAVPAMAHDVTISGNVTFASLDGSSLDHDGVVNGVFTVNDGNLIVNGTINCNDDSGSDSACNMSFVVSGDVIINSGGGIFAENRTGTGSGGNITISAGGNITVNGTISSAARSSTSSGGGAITS